MLEATISQRLDGTYEEKLDGKWIAIYFEDPDTGLFNLEIYNHDVSEFSGSDYVSLEEAQQVAHEFYDNQVY